MKRVLLGILLVMFVVCGFAQPQPGDVYCNYYWTTGESQYKFLRVIGDGDYREPVHFAEVYPKDKIKDGWILLDQDVDLKKAIRAEVQIEKLLSHDETENFSVKINNSKWIKFPESEFIPEPQSRYLNHDYPVVDVPLKYIKEGMDNKFRFKVDSTQRFGMPQNILYGVCLRIYYKSSKPHAFAEIKALKDDKIKVQQNLELQNVEGDIQEVDFVGLYEDVNYQTDGKYRQWQYTYYRGEMKHQIGHITAAPYKVTWDAQWVPDQKDPIEVGAIIKDNSGICYFTESLKDLQLERDYEVRLCKPFNQPQLWATREGEFTHAFDLNRNPEEAFEFRLVWTSWSPGYFNGIYLNDWIVFTREGHKYTPGFHLFQSKDCYMLNWGTNTVKTGKTPKVFGNMVHGAEVLYPGVMALVKFLKSSED